MEQSLPGKTTRRKTTPFTGAASALITPFRDGEIDFAAFRKLLTFQLGGSIDGLVVAGTTGEAATLSEKERDSLLSVALEEVCGRVPVIMGTGHNDTARAVALTRRAAELGADAALVVTPYYNKGTSAGIHAHFLKIAEASSVPLILYNVPSRTGVSLSVEDYRALSVHPNIVGVKEADGNIEKFAWLCHELAGQLAIYTGNDAALLPALSLGADGVISVFSNLLPAHAAGICALYRSGKVRESAALFFRDLPLIRLLFREVNPAPLKYAMSLLGFGSGEVRLPLSPIEEALATAIRTEIYMQKRQAQE